MAQVRCRLYGCVRLDALAFGQATGTWILDANPFVACQAIWLFLLEDQQLLFADGQCTLPARRLKMSLKQISQMLEAVVRADRLMPVASLAHTIGRASTQYSVHVYSQICHPAAAGFPHTM